MNQPNLNNEELKAKIRQQYDFLPYPDSEIDILPTNPDQLFIHSLVTPYYLRHQQVVDTKNKVILDAGCGSGMQSLVLALANPGAKIIGVDLSEKSVELARQRFDYHHFENAEFYALSIDDIGSLGYQFDYINCDEVLYLLPNPEQTLQTFQSVLAPQGIIRTNLHNYHQRVQYYRTQEAFRVLGLFEEESLETSLQIVKETIHSFKDNIRIKAFYQDFENFKLKAPNENSKAKQLDEWLIVNCLLHGDKGYTIPEMFDFLESASLDFLSMVNWRHWNLMEIFQDPDNLPLFWQLGLDFASEEDKLHLFELFQPIHRLMDFWCVKKTDQTLGTAPVSWNRNEWLHCLVHLHPILQISQIKTDVLQTISQRQAFEFSKYIKITSLQPVTVDSTLMAVLLPLWDAPQSVMELVKRWLAIQPLALDTLALKTEEQGFLEICELLTKLETFAYVLLEQP